jgi:hypothetical protein
MSPVYFAERDGLIKIGCSADPTRRVAQLGGARLLAVIPEGDFQMEAKLHGVFALNRVEGEWFSDSPELRQVVTSYRVYVSGLPPVITVRSKGSPTYHVCSDDATWVELRAGVAGRHEDALARYLRVLDRLRPLMEDEPELTVAEALAREEATA